MYPRFHATKRFDLLEIPIPGVSSSTSTKFPIPDQPQLRTDQDADVVIQAIETWTVADVPLGPLNIPLPTLAQLGITYLTLYVNEEESLYRIPLVQLHRTFAQAGTTPATEPAVFQLQAFKNIRVDWTKSYFTVPVAYGSPPGTFTPFEIMLGVHYYKLPAGASFNIDAVEIQQFKAVRPVAGQQ